MTPTLGSRKLRRVCVLIFLACISLRSWGAEVEQERIVAAMSLQLLTFTEWPKEEIPQIIEIGVIESELLYKELESLVESPRYKGKFALRKLAFESPSESFEGLQALFLGSQKYQEIARTIKRLDNGPILLMSSSEDFLSIGGMVNFTLSNRKVRFEINLKNANAKNIKFRAQLLRIASRVIEE